MLCALARLSVPVVMRLVNRIFEWKRLTWWVCVVQSSRLMCTIIHGRCRWSKGFPPGLHSSAPAFPDPISPPHWLEGLARKSRNAHDGVRSHLLPPHGSAESETRPFFEEVRQPLCLSTGRPPPWQPSPWPCDMTVWWSCMSFHQVLSQRLSLHNTDSDDFPHHKSTRKEIICTRMQVLQICFGFTCGHYGQQSYSCLTVPT